MNGIEIRTRPEEWGEKRRLAGLLFLVAGVFGLLGFFRSMTGVSFAGWVVYPSAAVLCGLIWYTYYGQKRAFLLLIIGAVLAYGAAIFLLEDTFRKQIRYIMIHMSGGDVEETAVTETALLLAGFLSFFIAMAEFLVHSHVLLYLLTTGLLLLSPFWGVRPGVETVVMLAVFQIAFWAMQTAEQMPWRPSFEGMDRGRLAAWSGMAAGILLLVAFLFAGLFASRQAERLYSLVYGVEGQLYRTMNRLSGRASEHVTGGRMGRGNNYRTGTPHLEVLVEEKPVETMYLCGFWGGEYIGGDWRQADDETLFQVIEEELGWDSYSGSYDWTRSMYHSMYFVMNANFRETENPGWNNMVIRHSNKVYDTMFIPYYNQGSWNWHGDTMYDGYTFSFYERRDIDIDWDSVPSGVDLMESWYKELRDAYAQKAAAVYVEVPMAVLPRLTALCQENPLDSLDEITAFILYTLHSRASYTMTPGWSPLNEDIVEYFLFEGGRGYCEHFAAAATLMYRLYGIPARYVSGYVVQPSSFEQQEDGGWLAVVTDEAAHAWPEIFLQDYGWMPVEVTPAIGGGSVASYPGFDGAVFGRILQERGWDEDRRNQDQVRNRETGIGGEGFMGGSIDFASYEKWLYASGGILACLLCVSPVLIAYARLRRLQRWETAGCRKVFFRLKEMLSFAGILSGYDGTEADFAGQLSKVTGVSEIEIVRMLETVSEAAYGIEAPSPEREDAVRETCAELAQRIYESLGRRRKWVFRYWKAFI